jgi:hypothetical protein
MKSNSIGLGLLIFALAACGQKSNEMPTGNAAETNTAPVNEPAAQPAMPDLNALQSVNQAQPVRPAPLAEPKGPIDPKSVEAAGQVVQHYGALIEQGRWAEGWKLWSSVAAAKAFERNLRDYADVHLEIGDLGDSEGAAGSIYVTVPAAFYGKLHSGKPGRLQTNIILRRVNDVPGSTEAQRRWHIERIETNRA